MLRTATDRHVVIEKESPWAEGRTVYICSGADMLLTRNAAEEAARAIIAAAPPTSDWIQTTFDAELDEGVRDYVDQLLFEWDDAELPLADLTMDVEARTPREYLCPAGGGGCGAPVLSFLPRLFRVCVLQPEWRIRAGKGAHPAGAIVPILVVQQCLFQLTSRPS